MTKSKHVTPKELAHILRFEIAGKLRRRPDNRYGIDGHYPTWEDEAGNLYLCGRRDDVCPGCIVLSEGGVL